MTYRTPEKEPASTRGQYALVWLREDLRLADNPALCAAVATKLPVAVAFVLDERAGGMRARGGAARWWLHGSLEALSQEIARRGGRLDLFAGDAGEIISRLATSFPASTVFWNRRYEAAGRAQDDGIAAKLRNAGITVETCNGKLLCDPESMRSKSGTPFRIFAAFRRALAMRGELPMPLPAPRVIAPAPLPANGPQPVPLAALHLLPTKPDWAGGLRETWTPGEASAQKRLQAFAGRELDTYADGRDQPAKDGTTRLSPHLASGELSSLQVWDATRGASERPEARAGVEKLSSEIAWRDFSYHLLVSNPEMATTAINQPFERFPWLSDAGTLRAWQRGETGYPVVDAGMRQLWQTGWMHNRVRLIAGSFLVKHLLIDWREGERWFSDTLCDADPANNAVNWQWVAGAGADAAPYFRIFNPVLQGERFDPDGAYTKRFVPELANMPARFIHHPWDAPADVLRQAGVALGSTYPKPIVEHRAARARALDAFARMRNA